jgi:hypothetical protein
MNHEHVHVYEHDLHMSTNMYMFMDTLMYIFV